MYQNNPFTEFTLENLRPIRIATGLGYSDIKHIILEYNTNTSAGHPKPIEINIKEFATLEELSSFLSKVSVQAFNDYLIHGKCIFHVLDDDIVRHSSEKERIKDKEP